MDKIHTSSRHSDWETPAILVADLSMVFHWDLDVCASRPNVCERFFSPEQDGLSQEWHGLCWMNPPYGKKNKIDKWMNKARIQGRKEDTAVVCLPPARTGTRWWQDNTIHASLIVLIRGRLTFGSDEWWQYLWDTPIIDGKPNAMYGKHGQKNSAGFPSAFVVFGKLSEPQVFKLCSYGQPVFNAPAWYMAKVARSEFVDRDA